MAKKSKIVKGALVIVWDALTQTAKPAQARHDFEAEELHFAAMDEDVVSLADAHGHVQYFVVPADPPQE